jgi:hypothetical protein
MDATGDAPGANDDAAGVSALLETARVLSKHKFAATLVYSADSGEEQGLYGGLIIAQYASDQGWNVEPELDADGKPVDTLYPSLTPKQYAGEPVGQPSWRSAAGKPSR